LMLRSLAVSFENIAKMSLIELITSQKQLMLGRIRKNSSNIAKDARFICLSRWLPK